MPSRIIREGIVSSQRVNALSLGAEVLYRRLMSVADDFGRYHGSLLTIRVACFPTNPERFREKEFGKWMNELLRGEDPLVKTFIIGGITYLEIQQFGQQRRGKSKFPAPPWYKDQQDTEETANQEINRTDNGCLTSVEADVTGSRSRSRMRSRSRIRKTPHTPQGGLLDSVDGIEPKVELPATVKRPQKVWYDDAYEQWYTNEYWCHRGKDTGRKSYEKQINEHFDREKSGYNQAKIFLVEMARSFRARFENTGVWESCLKTHPSTWLNQHRWTDEAPTEIAQRGNGCAPQPTAAERRRSETVAGLELLRQLDGRLG